MSGERPKPIATYVLLLVNLISYVLLAWQSQNFLEIDRVWMSRYGFVNESFFDGAYWQVITNMFVHFDFPHLGYNMLFLVFFGSRSEELFGRMKTLFFYLLFGTVTTSVALIYPLGTVSAGASGAIFGILGADLVAQRGVYVNRIWSSFLYGLVFFFFAAATGFLAHLVGLLIGFIVGYLATWNWYMEEEGEEESKTLLNR
jgi:rhomboid protease GluP